MHVRVGSGFIAWISSFHAAIFFRIFSYDHLFYFYSFILLTQLLYKNMADKNKDYYDFKKDTPKTVTKVPKKTNLSNFEDVCITQSSPLSLKSPLESQETKTSGTPSLFISQHLKASQEVHISGSQDSIS